MLGCVYIYSHRALGESISVLLGGALLVCYQRGVVITNAMLLAWDDLGTGVFLGCLYGQTDGPCQAVLPISGKLGYRAY